MRTHALFGLGSLFCLVAAAPACTVAGRDRAPPPAEGGAPSQGASETASAPAPEAASAEPPPAPEEPVLTVPRASAPVVPAGHFRVKVWEDAARTRTWLDERGRGAVPVSEARFLWRAGELYVRVYAGDLDLQVHAQQHDGPVWNDDSVALSFAAPDGRLRIIQISPTGVVADGVCPGDAAGLDDARCDLTWESHVRVATDYDGTLNRTGDFDEEWNVEAAIPLAAIAPAAAGAPGAAGAGTRIPLALSRCDVTANGRRSCGSWGKPGRAGRPTIVLGDS